MLGDPKQWDECQSAYLVWRQRADTPCMCVLYWPFCQRHKLSGPDNKLWKCWLQSPFGIEHDSVSSPPLTSRLRWENFVSTLSSVCTNILDVAEAGCVFWLKLRISVSHPSSGRHAKLYCNISRVVGTPALYWGEPGFTSRPWEQHSGRVWWFYSYRSCLAQAMLGRNPHKPCWAGIRTNHVKWVRCHHAMARPRFADRGDGLQIWSVAANVLNKQSRTADSGWSSSLGFGRGANNPPT
jgi:hypothetical protein